MILWIATCALFTRRCWANGDAQVKKNISMKSTRLCSHSFWAFSLWLADVETRTSTMLYRIFFSALSFRHKHNKWIVNERQTTKQQTPHGMIIRSFHFEAESNSRVHFIGPVAQWNLMNYYYIGKWPESHLILLLTISVFLVNYFIGSKINMKQIDFSNIHRRREKKRQKKIIAKVGAPNQCSKLFLNHFHVIQIHPPAHLLFPSHRHAYGSLSILNADWSANEWEIKRNEYYRCRYMQTNVGLSTTVRLIKLIEYKLPALVNEAKKKKEYTFIQSFL